MNICKGKVTKTPSRFDTCIVDTAFDAESYRLGCPLLITEACTSDTLKRATVSSSSGRGDVEDGAGRRSTWSPTLGGNTKWWTPILLQVWGIFSRSLRNATERRRYHVVTSWTRVLQSTPGKKQQFQGQIKRKKRQKKKFELMKV